MADQGRNISKEQRGEMRQEAKVDDDGGSGQEAELPDDKKPTMGIGDDFKDLKDEYIKAYYASLLEQQKLAEKVNHHESVGKMKRKLNLTSIRLSREEER